MKFFEPFLQDVRYGLRQLRHSPGFTAVAILTLALGIGANTAVFTVVNAVLIRPLPFTQPDRLIRVWESELKPNISELQPGRENLFSTSSPGFLDWQSRNELFEQAGAYHYFPSRLTLTSGSEPRELVGVRVTTNLFSTLGAQPALGRSFLPEEGRTGNDAVVILSYDTWKTHFNGDEHIAGKTATINARQYLVAGVMPRGFRFPRGEDLWLPLDLQRPGNSGHPGRPGSPRNTRNLETVARLKPGVTIERARQALSTMAEANAREYPDSNNGWGVTVESLREELSGKSRAPLLLLLAATGFVTLIACANLANMLLARASNRRREMAARASLGAPRVRLLQQAMVESLLLALLAGAIGWLAGWWAVKALARLGSRMMPELDQLALDWRVLAAVLGCSVVTGIFAGLASALDAWRTNPGDALREGGRTGSASARLSGALTVAELALALVLLTGAGLMLNTLARLYDVNLGFEPRGVTTARIAIPGYKYNRPAAYQSLVNDVVARTESVPGVDSAAFIYPLPFSGKQEGTNFEIEGRQAPSEGRQLTHIRLVTPHYFRAMRVPLVRGRYFGESDGAEAPKVVVINETLAARAFPNENPIGQRMHIKNEIREIVGVVSSVRNLGLDLPAGPETYLPYAQLCCYSTVFLVARGSGDPSALASALRTQVHSVDPQQPVEDVQTMEERIATNAADRRFYAVLLGAFAAIAIALAAIGVYGVTAYSVAQRTHEIGIRMAVGARPVSIYALLLGKQLRYTCIALALGLSAALMLTRLMSALLFGVRPRDPLTYILTSLLLTIVALAACYIPSRRAAKLDPLIALRYE